MASVDPGPGFQIGDTAIPSTLGQTGVGAPVCRASDLLGSHRTVDTLIERDAIATSYRDEGMTVWVTGTAELYRLVGGLANTDWFLEGSIGGGSALVRDYVAGVVLNDAVYQTTVAGQVDQLDATASSTGLPLGVVRAIDVPVAGKCIVVQSGDVGGFAGLTIGARYIASQSPGALVREDDTGNANYPDTTPGSGEVFAPVGIAKSATELTVQPGAGIVGVF